MTLHLLQRGVNPLMATPM